MKPQNYFWMCFDFPEMTCQKCRGAGMILRTWLERPIYSISFLGPYFLIKSPGKTIRKHPCT
jgi:hypothetical protein